MQILKIGSTVRFKNKKLTIEKIRKDGIVLSNGVLVSFSEAENLEVENVGD